MRREPVVIWLAIAVIVTAASLLGMVVMRAAPPPAGPHTVWCVRPGFPCPAGLQQVSGEQVRAPGTRGRPEALA